jgi:hypothetical protein
MTRTLWILAVLSLALPRAASADPDRADRIKVAVVPGIAVNLDAARVDALSQDLANALQTELDIDAVGGVEVRRKLPEAGLQPDCVANQACIADVARRLEATQLLFVVMIDTGTGGAIQVDSTWIDPKAHKSVSRPAIDIAAIAEAKSRFSDAAQQLLPDAPVRPKPTGMGRFSEPVPRHFTLPTYVTAGATAVGIGLGIGFGLRARSKYKDCEDMAPLGAECSQDRKSSIRHTAVVADIGWVVALGGTIATAVLYATSAEAPHIIVEPAPGGATVSAVGRFW